MALELAEVFHYGILSGIREDNNETILKIAQMNEKAKASYAEEYLGVKCKDGDCKLVSLWSVYYYS